MELLLHDLNEAIEIKENIYIPIWSYFYCAESSFNTSSSSFTFQYGATSTLNNYYLQLDTLKIYIPIWSYFYDHYKMINSLLILFTFQYGATSTQEVKPQISNRL